MKTITDEVKEEILTKQQVNAINSNSHFARAKRPLLNKQEMAVVARRAAELIQEHGKATGDLRDADDRLCALGAMYVASTGKYWLRPHPQVEKVLRDAFTKRIGDPFGFNPSIPEWNDNKKTTAEDIAKVYLQIADELEVAE